MAATHQNHKIFVFFPCEGKLGGAERRLIRTFTYIEKFNPTYSFTVGLLALTKLDEKVVTENYRAFTNLPILYFHSNFEIFKHIRKSDYSVVCYTDCSYRCLPVLIAALISRKKRFMMCTDTMGSSQHLKPKLRQLLYNLDIRLSNRIDCLYPSNTNLLQLKFKKKKITCTPCSFTDVDKYKPKFPKKKEIIFLGRLVEFKGIDLFVNAMIKIADKIRENGFQCYIYGNGNLEENIIESIERSNCEDIIHCMGHIIDSSKVLPRSRIFCSLQTMGNYPSQSMLEAMACGNYCIATDTYDSYLLINESFGQLIPHEENCLADAVTIAMEYSEKEYEIIAKNARDFLKEKHNIQLSSEYFENIFAELI